MTDARGQILVVERDPTLGRELVDQLLADGYPAELAENIGRATVTASTRVPLLMVLGELDPPRGALELLQRIRGGTGMPTSYPWRADLPVIVLGSHTRQADVLRAFDAGADDFIARPVRYMELRARLRALLRRSEHTPQARLVQVGALMIDTDSRAVSLHGEQLHLRRLEYELLVRLAISRDGCSASRSCSARCGATRQPPHGRSTATQAGYAASSPPPRQKRSVGPSTCAASATGCAETNPLRIHNTGLTTQPQGGTPMSTTSRPAAVQTVVSVLGDHPDTTAAEIATTGELGHSTVSKILTKLESTGKVKRSAGGRDGARRLPDRWNLAGSRSRKDRQAASGDRLGPGPLDGLVLDYMRANVTDEPLGPTAIAKGLGRSSGAVGNCLKRLSAAGKVRQAGEHPLRYAAGGDPLAR